MAQAWQKPDIGEQAVAQMASMPAEARAQGIKPGHDKGDRSGSAEGANADMGRAILALYRSAAQPVMRDLGARLPQAAAKPGLAIIATEDFSLAERRSHVVLPNAPAQRWRCWKGRVIGGCACSQNKGPTRSTHSWQTLTRSGLRFPWRQYPAWMNSVPQFASWA